MVGGRVVFNTRAKLLSFAIWNKGDCARALLKESMAPMAVIPRFANWSNRRDEAASLRHWRSTREVFHGVRGGAVCTTTCQPCMRREHQRRGGAHLTSFAVLAARTSVGVHPASFCRDRSTCASGEVHRVCTYARCGCGDSSSCAVSAASVVVYIATLLAEFWELASDAHAAPASMAEYTFSFCGVCGARSTCTQRQPATVGLRCPRARTPIGY